MITSEIIKNESITTTTYNFKEHSFDLVIDEKRKVWEVWLKKDMAEKQIIKFDSLERRNIEEIKEFVEKNINEWISNILN